MLAVSPGASEAISTTLQRVEVPDGAGLRFTAGQRTDHGIAIEITFVIEPGPGDQVVDLDAPADVFLEPAAAELLDDQVLDAHSEDDGRLVFSLRPQAGDIDET